MPMSGRSASIDSAESGLLPPGTLACRNLHRTSGRMKDFSDFSPRGLPRLKDIRVDGSIVAFTTLVALMTGLLFGLAPAFQASKLDPIQSLKEGGASGPSRQGNCA